LLLMRQAKFYKNGKPSHFRSPPASLNFIDKESVIPLILTKNLQRGYYPCCRSFIFQLSLHKYFYDD